MNPASIGQTVIHQFMLMGFPKQLSSLFALAIFIAVEICLVVLLAKLLKETYQEALRLAFRSKYHILLNNSVSIKLLASMRNQAAVTFRTPHWVFSNKDGSRDKRRRNNRLIGKSSVLQISHFAIKSQQPYLIYWLYKELALRNISIASPQIVYKGSTFPIANARKPGLYSSGPTSYAITEIYEHYKSHPTDFEEYCTDLFRQQGYKAKTTPRTNDGGYDIKMADSTGNTYIVECKCYNPQTESVGRDTLQKLVGANACVQATRMIFITTSHFTDNAIKYAQSIPDSMELIDGTKLEQLIRSVSWIHNGKDASHEHLSAVPCQIVDWNDIAQYFPPDIQLVK